MAHHHHDGDDAYHVDQLCMVGLSAAFGGICLGLYFWKQEMLGFMLAEKLQIFLVISGVVLLLLAVLRAISLWLQPAAAHSHAHDEAGCCDHDHSHDHDHAHAHEHAHDHDHAHTHDDHSDHDHGWAPWRYMVLLFPIILFLLGLPNKGPQVQAYGATGLSTANQSQLLKEWSNDSTVRTKDYNTIVRWAHSSTTRNQFRGKLVEVRGQYAPASATEFRLVRFRIACCGADATPLDVPIISSEKIEDWAPNAWIEVRGRVDFEQLSNGKTMTVIRIPGPNAIQKCPPQPYLQ